MDLSEVKSDIKNLDLLAKQVVEGFITGIHKSPFHGFSVEFSEHKLYNKGESTRHIDWKLFAKTEKLYTKKYEEETNLRCHIIIDLMEILKRQRDAVGLSIYGDSYEYYAPEKGSERHRKMLLHQLEQLLVSESKSSTETYKYLHEIAEKIHRRSLIFVFTDMFQPNKDNETLFEALKHLKFNKHEVVLFHTYDGETEFNFNFDNNPKKFVDVETGEEINIYAENIREKYTALVGDYFKELKNKCLQYKIDYIPVDIRKGYNEVLTAYLISRKKI